MIALVTPYELVLAGHVTANIMAYGILFTRPLLPAETASAHHACRRILGTVVTYSAVVALLAGAYMATDSSTWGAVRVQVPPGVSMLLLAIGGSVLTRGERAMALAASDGEQPDADVYAAHRRQLDLASRLCAVLVLVAVATMTVKPFA